MLRLEHEVIARSDVLMAVVYSQIEGFFDSVMSAPSPIGTTSPVTRGLEASFLLNSRIARSWGSSAEGSTTFPPRSVLSAITSPPGRSSRSAQSR